jgi:hypothetical protein
MTRYVPQNIPRAHHVEMGRCEDPSCGALHLILCDEDDEPIAVAVLTQRQVERAMEWSTPRA